MLVLYVNHIGRSLRVSALIELVGHARADFDVAGIIGLDARFRAAHER
jgi:hypothetical protein